MGNGIRLQTSGENSDHRDHRDQKPTHLNSLSSAEESPAHQAGLDPPADLPGAATLPGRQRKAASV